MNVLDHVDEATAERIRYKAAPEFVTRLDAWITSRADEEFTPGQIEQKNKRLSAEWVEDIFNESRGLPVFTRLEHVANTAARRLKNEMLDGGGKWAAADTAGVRRQVSAMFPHKDALAMYKAFYQGPVPRNLFKPLGRKKIEYADVFPLIYTIISTSRYESYGHIRHLLSGVVQELSLHDRDHGLRPEHFQE